MKRFCIKVEILMMRRKKNNEKCLYFFEELIKLLKHSINGAIHLTKIKWDRRISLCGKQWDVKIYKWKVWKKLFFKGNHVSLYIEYKREFLKCKGKWIWWKLNRIKEINMIVEDEKKSVRDVWKL